jgi:hypothetical protein
VRAIAGQRVADAAASGVLDIDSSVSLTGFYFSRRRELNRNDIHYRTPPTPVTKHRHTLR